MNRETCKKLLENGVLKAFANGERLEYKGAGETSWYDVSDPNFNGLPDQYRIKPKPPTVAMRQEDYPPVFWVKMIGRTSVYHLVTCMDEITCIFGEDDPPLTTTYEELAHNWEYSVDRKHWKPCTKELVPND